MKKLLLLTGPQGSGNHIFSRIFSRHSKVKGWDAILESYWVPTDEDFFSEYFIDPSGLTEGMFDGSDYFVTDISCPFVYDGKTHLPDIKGFIEAAENLGVEVIVGVISRDEHINTEQQIRLRGKKTLDIFMREIEGIDNQVFLSLETLFLHKTSYLNWISKVMEFPIDTEHVDILKFLSESPNKKYVKYVDEYWLDNEVKKGLMKFKDRL